MMLLSFIIIIIQTPKIMQLFLTIIFIQIHSRNVTYTRPHTVISIVTIFASRTIAHNRQGVVRMGDFSLAVLSVTSRWKWERFEQQTQNSIPKQRSMPTLLMQTAHATCFTEPLLFGKPNSFPNECPIRTSNDRKWHWCVEPPSCWNEWK